MSAAKSERKPLASVIARSASRSCASRLSRALAKVSARSSCCFEAGPLLRVGFILLPRGENRVVLIKLGIEHAQPIEFGEQNARRFAHRPHGIVWVHFFPGLEFSLRARKIQIVEPPESAIQPRQRQACIRLRNTQQQQDRGSGKDGDLYPSRP